jgi:hypothetical protein
MVNRVVVGEINGTLVVDQKCGRLVTSELQIVKNSTNSGDLLNTRIC